MTATFRGPFSFARFPSLVRIEIHFRLRSVLGLLTTEALSQRRQLQFNKAQEFLRGRFMR